MKNPCDRTVLFLTVVDKESYSCDNFTETKCIHMHMSSSKAREIQIVSLYHLYGILDVVTFLGENA